MSIVENLNRIKSCKENIKQAIINKGVDMEGVAFEGYADKINEITGGSTPEVPADFDYLIYRNNMTEYSNAEVYNIVEYAFAGCPNLSTVDLPNIPDIPTGAFLNCSNLASVNVPYSHSVGYFFQN